MSGALLEVSIVIKALNEERHIGATIESAFAALAGAGLSGEVILADSASTDRTVEIASRYPIIIVRLNRIADRACGAGVQLGYQYCRGRFICLIDGDMRLYENFLSAALRFLKEYQQFAGVGGIIVEREAENLEYVKRASANDADRLPGIVDHLDCGGLYRREAIAAAGCVRAAGSWRASMSLPSIIMATPATPMRCCCAAGGRGSRSAPAKCCAPPSAATPSGRRCARCATSWCCWWGCTSGGWR